MIGARHRRFFFDNLLFQSCIASISIGIFKRTGKMRAPLSLAVIVLVLVAVCTLPVNYLQPDLIQSSTETPIIGISTVSLSTGSSSVFSPTFSKPLASTTYEVAVVSSGANNQLKYSHFYTTTVSQSTTQLTINLTLLTSLTSPAMFFMGILAVDQSLSGSIIIVSGITSTSSSSN